MSAARIFRGMDRIFLKTFAPWEEGGTAQWLRAGQTAPDTIRVIFNRRWAEVSVDGFRVDEGQPTAWVSLANAKAIAPDRSEDSLFRHGDTLTVSGATWAVESCRPDGQTMCEVRLSAGA